MAKRDVIDDLVDIRYPWPEADEAIDEDALSAWRDDTAREREDYEQGLRLREEHDEGGWDPLLAELGAARRDMREAEERMRRLVAYGREFPRPHPYQLKQLAEATGMSISGTRSAYTIDEVATVAHRIGRQPRFRDQDGEPDTSTGVAGTR